MDARSPAAPILNVVGDTVALGPICPDHLAASLGWLNDFDVLRTTIQVRPLTLTRNGRSGDPLHAGARQRACPTASPAIGRRGEGAGAPEAP